MAKKEQFVNLSARWQRSVLQVSPTESTKTVDDSVHTTAEPVEHKTRHKHGVVSKDAPSNKLKTG